MNPNMMNRNAMGYYGMNRSRMGQRDMNNGCMRNNMRAENGCDGPDSNNMPESGCGCSAGNNRPENNCGCSAGNNRPENNCGCSAGNNRPENNCGCSAGNNRPENGCGCMNSQQLMNMNRHQLMCYLNQVSFSMYDTVLFLDTHPCDREAIAYFNKMQQARKCALTVYQQKFGPLLLDDVDADCEWTWGMEPLPWETCNK